MKNNVKPVQTTVELQEDLTKGLTWNYLTWTYSWPVENLTGAVGRRWRNGIFDNAVISRHLTI